VRDLTLVKFFSNSQIVSDFTYNENKIFNSLILNLMRARLISHHMVSLLFVLRGLYNKCLFEVLQMICTE
jgi:hypothetical protein